MTFKDFRKSCDPWMKVTLHIKLPTYNGGSNGTFLFHYPWNITAEKLGDDQPMMELENIPHEFDCFKVDRFGSYYTGPSDHIITLGLYVSLSLPVEEEG